MFEHRDRLKVPVMHGVGAAFDFLTGRIPQAPRWMMNAGLEWLFRLIMEPRRLWKRYTITNLKFLYYVVTREIFRSKS
jgi:N-acetylglucosaminyldiphosphoundecaprenol N-acetyl-beta-D-mannosaminyltransferase